MEWCLVILSNLCHFQCLKHMSLPECLCAVQHVSITSVGLATGEALSTGSLKNPYDFYLVKPCLI